MTTELIAAALGGPRTLLQTVGTPAELVSLTREGLPAPTLQNLALDLGIDRIALAQLVGIPQRTLSRRLSSGKRLTPAESDRVVRLARIVALAREMLGTTAKAAHWLQSPNRALAGAVPLTLLDTDAGVQSVEAVLGRIAYGVYS